MIVKSHEADRFVAKPPKDLATALIFGPDAGLVHERADVLSKSVVDDLSDAFRVAELDESTLSSDFGTSVKVQYLPEGVVCSFETRLSDRAEGAEPQK